MKPLQLFLLFLLAGDCLGAGIVILPEHHHPPAPPRPPVARIVAPQNLPIRLHTQKTTARITDQIARTTIEQVFHNPNSRPLEGTFLFPVPKGAHLDGFTLEINGRRAEAELLDSGKARGIYEGIVRSLKDPALLEYADRDLYQIRIFPFPAHGDRTITISYTQVLPADSGLIEYTAPLGVTKHAAPEPRQVSLEIQLTTKAPLRSVWSATHEAKIVRQEKRATITYESADTREDSDFQLYFAATKTAFDARLLTHRQAGEDGYFLLLLSPGNSTQKTPAIAKDVTFVLDTSGSMAGNKLEQAKKALTFCVANLNDNDRFEVLRFSTEVEPLFDRLRSATPANRKAATEFIRDLRPYGSTAIDDALKTALQNRGPKSKHTHVVIFLTDGRPTIGTTREEEIVANVSKRNSALTRIFSFGIGTDVNTHLLDRITEKTRAASQYVLPDEDLEMKLSNFFSKIKDPVLADVRLEFPEKVRTLKQYPKSLPDLFKGDQLVVVGRYRHSGKGRLTLNGSVEGRTLAHDFELKFPGKSVRHGFIPRLWATRRVGYLLDEIRLNGERKELRDEVTGLAREYGIVTPYTAYLIVEDERRRDVSRNDRILPQLGQDAAAREQLTSFYRSLGSSKSGEAGVAGAKITSSLKNAQTSGSGRSRANVSARRAIQAAPVIIAPSAPAPAARPGDISPRSGRLFQRPGVTTAPLAAPSPHPALRGSRSESSSEIGDRITEYTRQNRHLAGKTFYWNGHRWIDAATRTLKDAKPIRIKFTSAEYFALATKDPAISKWLALGPKLTFTFGQKLYEIDE